ncbi:MAG: hypothetical protein P8Q90_00670 [Candidatus Thalassarchaeaceae archaeon]|nr:hypothetical protein [Candidatus Thalassarchaeaceae archaeon]
MEVGGALAAWLIPLLCVLGIIGTEWKWKYPQIHIADFFRADPFNQGICLLGIGILLVPLGWWIAIPAGAIGMGIRAIASEDSRLMWKTRWQARSVLVVAIVAGVIISGFGSVSEPIGAAEWGTPLTTENPDAPNWPASEQHIWNEGAAILVVNHVRLPGTLSAIGSGSMVLWHLENSETDEARLKQAMEQLEEIGFNADWFTLETIAYGQSYDYSGGTLPYTLKRVDLDGRKIAEMVTVAVGTWGGEIHLLTVIKPNIPGAEFLPFESDPYASQYVEPWLEANA